MSDYIRMLSYIYSYEDGRKNRNVGFARMEGRNGILRLFISIRSNYRNDLRMMQLYFYKQLGEDVVPLQVAEFRLTNGNCEFRTQIRINDLSDCIGMYIVSAHNEEQELLEFASCFKDIDFNISFFREKLAIASKPYEAEMPIILNEEASKIQNEDKEHEEEIEVKSLGEEKVGFWEMLSKKYPKCRVLGPDYECIKINTMDIDMFPDEYKNMGSNSFLLHGYYFYRHIMIAKKSTENVYYLCVPGYYQRNEQIAAAMFGFGRFLHSRECKMNEPGFGYWIMDINYN